MVYILPPPGQDGPCPCDQVQDACQCGLSCSLECRSKAGTGCLCGFSEFASPSNPPKKYRKLSYDGTRAATDYFSCDCTGSTIIDNHSWGGYCSFDSETCTESNNTTGFGCGNDATNAPDTSSGTWVTSPVITPTSQTWTAVVGCYAPGGGCPKRIENGGSFKMTLSMEDTSDDAEARALAAISDWSSSGDCSNNTSYRSARAPGAFCFSLRSGQVRVTFIGEKDVSYTVEIKLQRRPYPSTEEFMDFGTLSASAVGTGESETTDWIAIPNADGFETAASGCKVTQS